jgi:hypothetical protein
VHTTVRNTLRVTYLSQFNWAKVTGSKYLVFFCCQQLPVHTKQIQAIKFLFWGCFIDEPAHVINYKFYPMASARRQPLFNLFYGSHAHDSLDVLHSSNSQSWKPPMTWKVEALPVGQSPMGPGSTLKRIQCIRLTRLGASGITGMHLIHLLPLS